MRGELYSGGHERALAEEDPVAEPGAGHPGHDSSLARRVAANAAHEGAGTRSPAE